MVTVWCLEHLNSDSSNQNIYNSLLHVCIIRASRLLEDVLWSQIEQVSFSSSLAKYSGFCLTTASFFSQIYFIFPYQNMLMEFSWRSAKETDSDTDFLYAVGKWERATCENSTISFLYFWSCTTNETTSRMFILVLFGLLFVHACLVVV